MHRLCLRGPMPLDRGLTRARPEVGFARMSPMTRRWCTSTLAAASLLLATAACGSSESAEPTDVSLAVSTELRSSSADCVELVVEATSAFEGCASEFQAGPSVVFLDPVNSLYVVYVVDGTIVDGDGYRSLQSQGPFSLVTLIDTSRDIYEFDFIVQRSGGRVTCRPVGVIGFLECG